MTKPIALCAAAVMLAALGVARADSPSGASGIDPIAVRQAGYALQGGDFAYIRSVVEAKGDVKPLEVPAKAISKWGRVIPTLFPKGSETGENTKALPKIWSDPDGFQKIAVALVQASDKLATDAKAGATDLVAADTKELGKQCGACHKAYRAK
ncbi:c-type cytochrome [Rhodopila sp.]|uniref:c-type cytochrome n=1 Tax=Rhodopila sp. TaxID=2480087 RepID=UPI003D11FAD1